MENKNVCKKLGANIAKYRKRKKFSQKELANLAGISSQTLSCIETGVNYPSIKILIKITEYLEVSLAHLFIFDNNTSKIDSSELSYLAMELFKELDCSQQQLALKIITCIKDSH